MSIINLRLKNINLALNKLNLTKSTEKETKITIRNGLKLVINPSVEETQIINEVINLLDKPKLMKSNLEVIIKHRHKLLEILNRGINEPEIEGVYNYNNPNDMAIVNQLIESGTNINLIDYVNDHVMYAIIMRIPVTHNNVIIKFGYSGEILTRLESLKKEYNCPKINLIGIKRVLNQKDERKFHQLLQLNYSKQIEMISINGKEKTELYKLSKSLLDEFNKIINIKSYHQLVSENEMLTKHINSLENDNITVRFDNLSLNN